MKRQADGYAIATDNISGKTVDEHDTKSCCHCGAHFRVKLQSAVAGVVSYDANYCMRCDGPVCENPKCVKCFPFAQWLDIKEKPEPKIFTGPGNLIVLK